MQRSGARRHDLRVSARANQETIGLGPGICSQKAVAGLERDYRCAGLVAKQRKAWNGKRGGGKRGDPPAVGGGGASLATPFHQCPGIAIISELAHNRPVIPSR